MNENSSATLESAKVTKVYITESDIAMIAENAIDTMLSENPKWAVLSYINEHGEISVIRIRATRAEAVCILQAAANAEMEFWGEENAKL